MDVPYSIEAEESVLGSLLINWQSAEPEVVAKVMMSLKPEHFYRDKNRWVYEACLALYKKGLPIDELTVAYELKNQRKLEAVSAAYLPYLVGHICTPLHLEHYARIILDTYQERLKVG